MKININEKDLKNLMVDGWNSQNIKKQLTSAGILNQVADFKTLEEKDYVYTKSDERPTYSLLIRLPAMVQYRQELLHHIRPTLAA